MKHHSIIFFLLLIQGSMVLIFGQIILESSSTPFLLEEPIRQNVAEYEFTNSKQEQLISEKDKIIQQQQLAFRNSLNVKNKYLIIQMLVLILLLGGISLLLYQKEKIQTRLNIENLEQELFKDKIKPHFFFNVFNSLQGIILSRKPMLAYRYHTKFTKLLRLIFEHSERAQITLSEEMKSLRLYVELEQLRTGNAFEFEMVNKIVLNEEVMVPSMLLQPFVENAIWNGIMNREKGEVKRIVVCIDCKNDWIIYEIYDTGVGRKESKKIRTQKINKHKLMGENAMKNRLELFRLRYKTPLNFGIQDLVTSDGIVLGTKVKLKMPIIR